MPNVHSLTDDVVTSFTRMFSFPSSDSMKSSISFQDISWERMAMLTALLWQQDSRVGNRTAFSSGWLKYWKGKLASCCSTEGWLPDCTMDWLSGWLAVK